MLGVNDDAECSEVKQAYRSLAKTCHPDFLGDEGHDLCILLNEAYDVLSDPDERSQYNAKLEQVRACSMHARRTISAMHARVTCMHAA